CRQTGINLAKGLIQATLSRETANYLLNEINIQPFMNVLNEKDYGVDELLLSSLLSTEKLRVPGVYPERCLSSQPTFEQTYFTRLSTWYWERTADNCKSGVWRHNLCLFGMRDLPYLANSNYIMANKLLPSVDYGAISCMGEILFNRTHLVLNDTQQLDLSFYDNLPMVR
ncbi:hypothetical protein PFISCL1PPCAC_14168, partial [Pristionchus fissidentatus]